MPTTNVPADSQFINIWLIFWPVLTIIAYLSYWIVTKKQGKGIRVSYGLLMLGALLLWLVVLFLFKLS